VLLVSIIVGTRHVIAALLTIEFAFTLGEPPAANRAKQHRLAIAARAGFRTRFWLGVLVHR
jgi:hypothetical protein